MMNFARISIFAICLLLAGNSALAGDGDDRHFQIDFIEGTLDEALLSNGQMNGKSTNGDTHIVVERVIADGILSMAAGVQPGPPSPADVDGLMREERAGKYFAIPDTTEVALDEIKVPWWKFDRRSSFKSPNAREFIFIRAGSNGLFAAVRMFWEDQFNILRFAVAGFTTHAVVNGLIFQKFGKQIVEFTYAPIQAVKNFVKNRKREKDEKKQSYFPAKMPLSHLIIRTVYVSFPCRIGLTEASMSVYRGMESWLGRIPFVLLDWSTQTSIVASLAATLPWTVRGLNLSGHIRPYDTLPGEKPIKMFAFDWANAAPSIFFALFYALSPQQMKDLHFIFPVVFTAGVIAAAVDSEYGNPDRRPALPHLKDLILEPLNACFSFITWPLKYLSFVKPAQ